MYGIHDFVERGCGTALLLEPYQTQVCLAAVLKDSVEFGRKLDLSETQDCISISNVLVIVLSVTDS